MSMVAKGMPDHVWHKKIEILKAEARRLQAKEYFDIKDIDAVRMLVYEAKELNLGYEYWGKLEERIHSPRRPDAGAVVTRRAI